MRISAEPDATMSMCAWAVAHVEPALDRGNLPRIVRSFCSTLPLARRSALERSVERGLHRAEVRAVGNSMLATAIW